MSSSLRCPDCGGGTLKMVLSMAFEGRRFSCEDCGHEWTLPHGEHVDQLQMLSQEIMRYDAKRQDRIGMMMEALGYADTPGMRAHLIGVVEALDIFEERSRRHKEIWRAAGWRGLLVEVRKKTERLWNEYMVSEEPPDDLDSALDAINYLGLFMRAWRERVDGDWTWK